jgi:hypothetical protein
MTLLALVKLCRGYALLTTLTTLLTEGHVGEEPVGEHLLEVMGSPDQKKYRKKVRGSVFVHFIP